MMNSSGTNTHSASRHHAGFLDDLDFPHEASVWSVDLNEVRAANARLFDQLDSALWCG